MTGQSSELVLGRYEIVREIASGGMATVYLAKLRGPAGFKRQVAIKRMHPHVASDPDFQGMFLDEARLAASINHPNVVATLDVVARGDEALIVMEHVDGISLASLLRDKEKRRVKLPARLAAAVMVGALNGLHAAHEACGDDGLPLGIVHRDVSPQNVLVGRDGFIRMVDFGIAKATVRVVVTRDNQVKGKLCYMSPEQCAGDMVDRRSDCFAAAVIFFEMLAGRRLFIADDVPGLVGKVLKAEVPPLVTLGVRVPVPLEKVMRRALAQQADDRYASAQEFAWALEEAVEDLAPARDISDLVRRWDDEVGVHQQPAAAAGPLPTAGGLDAGGRISSVSSLRAAWAEPRGELGSGGSISMPGVDLSSLSSLGSGAIPRGSRSRWLLGAFAAAAAVVVVGGGTMLMLGGGEAGGSFAAGSSSAAEPAEGPPMTGDMVPGEVAGAQARANEVDEVSALDGAGVKASAQAPPELRGAASADAPAGRLAGESGPGDEPVGAQGGAGAEQPKQAQAAVGGGRAAEAGAEPAGSHKPATASGSGGASKVKKRPPRPKRRPPASTYLPEMP